MESWADFMDWAWARHHNEWSWYIRPLIILAFCLAAYLLSWVGVIFLALLFPVSAILFPAPEVIDPNIAKYRAQEKRLTENATLTEIMAFVGAVILFLSVLAAAFWKRNLWFGLLVANLGSLAKIVVNLWLWPEAGAAAIAPTIVTVVIFNSVVIALWVIYKNRASKNSRAQI